MDNLKERFPDLDVSIPTIKRARKQKGWVCTRPHYCQLIRDLNKRKCLLWCHYMKNSNEMYENVIFADECTMQLDRHSQICFRKKHQHRLLKPRAKHPAKIHIWGGISYRNATNVIIFTGNMDAPRYKQILEAGLLPFIKKCYPDRHSCPHVKYSSPAVWVRE